MNQIDTINIEFRDDDVTTYANAEALGNSTFQLIEFPLLATSASFGDVIEVESLDDETYLFIRIVEKSDWQTHQWLLAQKTIESAEMQELLSELYQRGAHWQIDFGGCLSIAHPQNFYVDVKKRISEIVAS